MSRVYRWWCFMLTAPSIVRTERAVMGRRDGHEVRVTYEEIFI